METHKHDAMIVELHGQKLSDYRIAMTIGSCRSLVQRRRRAMGLPSVGNIGRPKDATKLPRAPKPAPVVAVAPPVNPGGGVTKPTTQVDRFLAAFKRTEYARPEESERAKEAGRHGRMPSAPVATPLFSSSLERC